MQDFVKVARAAEIKRGEIKVVEVDGESILIANVAGDLYAVSETCTHEDFPLGEGFLEGEEVECVLHGSRFSVRTGQPHQEPATEPLKRYAVRVEGEDVLVGPA
ncbi:MAG: non-heme iron oxygenase ferredoxin subunit [SAR202 cluster bacterium]|nr:non-heme iron oxygenase ferredoxin subunit [SAR202 cluster bacterium]